MPTAPGAMASTREGHQIENQYRDTKHQRGSDWSLEPSRSEGSLLMPSCASGTPRSHPFETRGEETKSRWISNALLIC